MLVFLEIQLLPYLVRLAVGEWLSQPCSVVCLQLLLNLSLPPGPWDQLILDPWGGLALCSCPFNLLMLFQFKQFVARPRLKLQNADVTNCFSIMLWWCLELLTRPERVSFKTKVLVWTSFKLLSPSSASGLTWVMNWRVERKKESAFPKNRFMACETLCQKIKVNVIKIQTNLKKTASLLLWQFSKRI